MKSHNRKRLLLSSAIFISILCPPNVISKPSVNPKFSEFNQYSTKSFVTKAVEKAGSSVVTIETQKYVQQKNFQPESRLLLDPNFERFFRLDLPYDNQPKIEQSQGSGFFFEEGLSLIHI